MFFCSTISLSFIAAFLSSSNNTIIIIPIFDTKKKTKKMTSEFYNSHCIGIQIHCVAFPIYLSFKRMEFNSFMVRSPFRNEQNKFIDIKK